MKTLQRAEILRKIAHVSPENFEEIALDVFRYQAKSNRLYAEYLHLLGRNPQSVARSEEIPFLPIQLYKRYKIKTGRWLEQEIFYSSGTTGQTPSKHFVRDVDAYRANTVRGFQQFYGNPKDWCTLALLPSYLEREGSSLVVMADHFIRCSKYALSGFFLHDHEALKDTLAKCQDQQNPTLLLGVSFALLDFSERFPMDLHGITVMETGGMKGRRKEMTKQDLHQTLKDAFHLSDIHSEYGMTELLSQGYSKGDNIFRAANTLRVLTMELQDPFCCAPIGRTGVINVIDLANIDTCSFIATEDLGKRHADGSFEILGRMDTAEMRGCNLMVQ